MRPKYAKSRMSFFTCTVVRVSSTSFCPMNIKRELWNTRNSLNSFYLSPFALSPKVESNYTLSPSPPLVFPLLFCFQCSVFINGVHLSLFLAKRAANPKGKRGRLAAHSLLSFLLSALPSQEELAATALAVCIVWQKSDGCSFQTRHLILHLFLVFLIFSGFLCVIGELGGYQIKPPRV